MYEAFYKLQGKPFQLTPDPEFLFPSMGHRRAMSYLRYGLEQGEGFVVITGAVGTGKTLLIQALSRQLGPRDVVMATLASANLHEDEVLPAVAAAFHLSYDGPSREGISQNLLNHLLALCRGGKRALLIVDEAQSVTPAALEMLRFLSNLEIGGRALLQVFLVGQTELKETIENAHMEQLSQRIIASCELRPLGEEECRAYILHRLKAAGWQEDPALASDLFPEIHAASQGIPRKINLIMGRFLLYGYLEELHELDRMALETVLGEMRDELPSMAASEAPAVPVAATQPRRRRSTRREQVDLPKLELRLSRALREVRRMLSQQEGS